MVQNPVFVGSRSVRKSGDSICVSIPRKELREQLNTEAAEIIGCNVLVSMGQEGEMTVDLSPHVDNPRSSD